MRDGGWFGVLNVCVLKDPEALAEDIMIFAGDSLLAALAGFDEEETDNPEACRNHINGVIHSVQTRHRVMAPVGGWFATYGSDIERHALEYNRWLDAYRVLTRYTQ